VAGLTPALSPEDHAALSSWRLGPVVGVALPATGTVSRTILVQTADGAYALRAYHRPDPARVEWEHLVIGWASAWGTPVCRPLPLPSGETVWEEDGCLFALFPLAEGRQVARADLREEEVASAGRCLARIHLAFADFPVAQARHKAFSFDTGATLQSLARIQEAITARSIQTDADRTAQQHLAGRREWRLPGNQPVLRRRRSQHRY